MSTTTPMGTWSRLQLVLGRPTPPGWRLREVRADGAHFVHREDGASAIVSLTQEEDGHLWLHASITRQHRLPSYADLKLLKEWLIGPDRYAYQVFPPLRKAVTVHPYALHLWTCLAEPGTGPGVEGKVLPDFTRDGRSI